MSRLKDWIAATYLNEGIDFRVRLFNVIATAGAILSLVTIVASLVAGEQPATVHLLVVVLALSIGLLIYVTRTGKYQRGYLITVIIIFFGFFPLIFFSGGGYDSGMPLYFLFAILFTVFMLEGKKALIFAGLELVLYMALFFCDFFFPWTVVHFDSPTGLFLDILLSFVLVSLALGITLFLHFRIYSNKRHQLEAAKEEALQYSEAKSAFLANMSHEIRTPINIILGMNEMILRESTSSSITEYAQTAKSASQTLTQLISDILDVTRIESGKLEIAPGSYRSADLAGELYVIGKEGVRDLPLTFKMRVGDSLPPKLWGDYLRIKQIATNLLSNAIKYTRKGTVTLTLEGKPGAFENTILLCITVIDTGIGIRKADIPYLFDAFARFDSARNRAIEGSGLGLAISKQLVDGMQGNITVHSIRGQGSTFRVEIPQTVVAVSELRAGDSDKTAPEAGSSFVAPGAQILAVDDNQENIQVIQALLKRTLVRVDAGESGAECLELVSKNHYDLILMDYMMPHMDGVETFRELVKIKGFNTPVIILTANAAASVKQELLKAGFADCLIKPVPWEVLENAVATALMRNTSLVTMVDHGSRSDIPNQDVELLKSAGIELKEGLRYLGGDLSQYKVIAALFLENCREEQLEIEDLLEKEDYAALSHKVHALKSRAKMLGAHHLSETAKKIEQLCKEESTAYISLALPVLRYEWQKVFEGLTAFLAKSE